MRYCESTSKTKRWKTREVMVGSVGIGADNPIRIQSMTTSDTRDVRATTQQIIRLADAGCEIARVTVQGKKEAEACEQIKNALVQQGYEIPIVADIHFYPPAAMQVIEYVDKVRVNPGNFADKRASFKVIEYDDTLYAAELERVEEKFTPLVLKCKQLNRAIRIGTNHGSLSDRVMNRYGDTPQGMVESALEFARICRKHDFHNFVFSMKASNPQVMILAYRLLVASMMQLGWDYPLHLGVTEAGQGEDGRIKSAMGIGALLLDGLGDTIRVSLTEDCWKEIEPCKRLVAFSEAYQGRGRLDFEEQHRDISMITRRHVDQRADAGLHRDGSVWLKVLENDIRQDDFLEQIGVNEETSCVDALLVEHYPRSPVARAKLRELMDYGVAVVTPARVAGGVRLLSLADLQKERYLQNQVSRFAVPLGQQEPEPTAVWIRNEEPDQWESLVALAPSVILLKPTENRLHYARQFFDWLQERELQIPVILGSTYVCETEDLLIQYPAEAGALLCDGLGEGVCCEAQESPHYLRQLGFSILQSARMRSSKTEFISCPSCGRTLFDLQDVSKAIEARTGHLPGVKIAVMGCIVNGPGEMADADFGYVGSRPGKIDLYVGKECVERNIDFSEAEERLVSLIKAHGRWVEAPDKKEVEGEPLPPER